MSSTARGLKISVRMSRYTVQTLYMLETLHVSSTHCISRTRTETKTKNTVRSPRYTIQILYTLQAYRLSTCRARVDTVPLAPPAKAVAGGGPCREPARLSSTAQKRAGLLLLADCPIPTPAKRGSCQLAIRINDEEQKMRAR